MQIIQVNNTMQDFRDKLESVAAPTFFDSITEVSIDNFSCKIGSSTAVTFTLRNSTNYYLRISLYDSNGSEATISFGTSTYTYPNLIIATDKAIIALNTDTARGAPFFIIAKDTDDNTVMCYHSNMTNPYGNAGAKEIDIYRLLGAGNAGKSYYMNNDTTTHDSYIVPLFVSGNKIVDGVYVGLVRPYSEVPGMMEFTVGSASCVGFGGTSLIVQDS